MSNLIDTHVHLDHPKLIGNLQDVLNFAKDMSVDRFINIGHDMESSRASVNLANKYPEIWASVGIHPHSAKEMQDSDLAELAEMASNKKVVAIGEIGLDYHYDYSPRDIQRRVFEKQLDLAQQLNLPVVIHQRESIQDCLDILRYFAPLRKGGVMHCFSGSVETMEICIELNLHIGLGGPVTFSNARRVKEVAAAVPLDRLLLETDCPYLTPHPHRGKTNQPGYLPLVAAEIAELRSVNESEVISTCTHNATSLFGLGKE